MFWFFTFLVVLVLLIQQARRSEASRREDIVFDSKHFYELGEESDVAVSVRLACKDINYEKNTTNISCHKERAECLVTTVDQIGPVQIGRLDSPASYPITKWDNYEIVSVRESTCMKETISLERKSETALWVQEAINQAGIAVRTPTPSSINGPLKIHPLGKGTRSRGNLAVTLKVDLILTYCQWQFNRRYPTTAPELCIEITSLGDTLLPEVFSKANKYIPWRTQCVRVIDPEKRTAWMVLQGANEPVWVPPSGALNIGETTINLLLLFSEVDKKQDLTDVED